MVKRTTIIFAILLVANVFQTANALEWVRKAGGESPGIKILDERPVCWFSISGDGPVYYISGSSTILLSDMQYWFGSYVIEYYANGGNGYPIETHVYDGTYNSLGQATGFKELRHYPISGNTYYIEIFDVSYNGFGQVMNGYLVNVSTSFPMDKPSKPTGPIPGDGAAGQPLTFDLSWSDGGDTSSYIIYFGTDSVPDESEFMGYQPGTTYDLGNLLYGTTYYWRIDAKNAQGTTEGDIWSFTTLEPPAGKIIFVDDTAAGANDGSSWADAYNYLQDALVIASPGDKIWVAQGIYKPNQGGGNTPSGREATFRLIDGICLRGGCAGFGESKPDARDIVVYETVLSGDLGGNDGLSFASNSENSTQVVTGSGTGKTTVLDGFTITAGNATGMVDCSQGGGMYNGSRSSPTVTNCTFSGNSAGLEGGGMYNFWNSSPILTNCTLKGNSANDNGGGMYNDESNQKLNGCIFTGNLASDGGGIYDEGSSTIFINCTFAGNFAKNGNALNCDSWWQDNPGNIELINCILWDGGNEIWNNNNSTIVITYSNVHGDFPGIGNINADPVFVEPGYWNPNETPEDLNDDFWVDGDYHLKSQAGRWDPNCQSWIQDDVTSPCIDAGDPSTPIGSEPLNNGGIINIGAYGGTAQASKSPAK